jgi:hypothetical protein
MDEALRRARPAQMGNDTGPSTVTWPLKRICKMKGDEITKTIWMADGTKRYETARQGERNEGRVKLHLRTAVYVESDEGRLAAGRRGPCMQ